jgi:hypothetical protein
VTTARDLALVVLEPAGSPDTAGLRTGNASVDTVPAAVGDVVTEPDAVRLRRAVEADPFGTA